jgi:Family of unknown function (DUF5996)
MDVAGKCQPHSVGAIFGLGNHLHVGLSSEHAAQASTHDHMVIGNEDSRHQRNRHRQPFPAIRSPIARMRIMEADHKTRLRRTRTAQRYGVTMASAWPALPFEAWRATCDTLHAHTQVLGKLAAELAPPEPQLQHAALRLTARGWETNPLPAPDLHRH